MFSVQKIIYMELNFPFSTQTAFIAIKLYNEVLHKATFN